MTTALQIVQTASTRLGLTSPSYAAGASDLITLQLLALLNEEGQELARRYPWTALQNEGSFTTLAAEDQGAISTIASGLNYIINDTIWNRSLRRPVFGPRTPQEWQQNKAFAINGPWSSYRIKGGHLYMYPTPTAGQSCYFDYITKNWSTDTTGATGKESLTVDTDIVLLDDNLLTLGLVWRFKAAKGLEYAEDYNKYERQVLDAMARDGGKDMLSLTNTKYDIFPGVVVPSGSWNL